jgi:hypothetical protein
MNILYIDDYINYYCYKNNKIIKYLPYKESLYKGIIINKNKFIKSFNKMLLVNNIKKGILNENIIVITNNNYSNLYKLIIKDILVELNYKNIKYINELSFLKIKKDDLYINYNYNYYYLYYVDEKNKIQFLDYFNNPFNKENINNIINYLNKKNIYIYGKNTSELLNILNSDIKYYVYNNSDNLLLNILLNVKE